MCCSLFLTVAHFLHSSHPVTPRPFKPLKQHTDLATMILARSSGDASFLYLPPTLFGLGILANDIPDLQKHMVSY
jgi:hypothetical protein